MVSTLDSSMILHIQKYVFKVSVQVIEFLLVLDLTVSVIISLQVRSLILDVKVWEPSVITLFQALGNVFANSIWEGSLQARRTVQADEIPMR